MQSLAGKCVRNVLVACLCAVFFTACSGKKAGLADEQAPALQPLHGIAIMPSSIVKAGVRAQAGSETSVEGIAKLVDGIVAEELGKKENIQILSEKQLDALLPDAAGGRLAQIKTLGAKLGVDAVLDITVNRFHDRDGSELSANTPASVAFEMVLTSVESGAVLWAGSFDETQESLSSNLFSIGKMKNRGLKWITAEALLSQGLKERLKDSPYLQ